MAPEAASSERVYRGLKSQILAGAFPMGMRMEIKAIAQEHGTSVTPVRDAIHRLIGERLIEMQSHGGFQLPMITEPALRDLYGWNWQLAMMAVPSRPASRSGLLAAIIGQTVNSALAHHVAGATATLFDLVAAWSGNREQRYAVGMVNDRLHRARLAEAGLIADLRRELRHMARRIDSGQGDMASLLETYHQRRMDRVAEIVGVMYAPRSHSRR
jgi:DNA-binding GntR family transcriptional regulator